MFILQRSCKWHNVYKTPRKMSDICIEIIFVVAVLKRLMMKTDDVVLSNVEKSWLLIWSCSPLKYVLLKTFALLLYSHSCTGSSYGQELRAKEDSAM